MRLTAWVCTHLLGRALRSASYSRSPACPFWGYDNPARCYPIRCSKSRRCPDDQGARARPLEHPRQSVVPGHFDTELNHGLWQAEAGQALIRRVPQRRLGQLADLDGPLLPSDASRLMTGSELAVGGGHLVSSL